MDVLKELNEVSRYIEEHITDDLSVDELANLLGLAVSKNYRRQGVAKSLILQVESWSRERNINMIRLNSGSTRKEAHAFYRALGFDNEKEQIRFMKKL